MCLSDALCFHINLESFSIRKKISVEFLVGITLNKQNTLFNMDILAISILPTHGRWISFHLLGSFSLLSSVLYSFNFTDVSISLVKFICKYFIISYISCRSDFSLDFFQNSLQCTDFHMLILQPTLLLKLFILIAFSVNLQDFLYIRSYCLKTGNINFFPICLSFIFPLFKLSDQDFQYRVHQKWSNI